MNEDTINLLKTMIFIANNHYDGHFTIMSFTTNWRAGFGTPSDWDSIKKMSDGSCIQEAMAGAIHRHYRQGEMG